MIYIDVDKTLNDARALGDIGACAADLAAALGQSRNDYRSAWQGGAGDAFQLFAEGLCAKLNEFRGGADSLASDIARVCAEFSEADNKIGGF